MLKVIHIFVVVIMMSYSASNASDSVTEPPKKPEIVEIKKVPTFIPVPTKRCVVDISEEESGLQRCVNVKKKWLHI